MTAGPDLAYLGQRARIAARQLAGATTLAKDAALREAGELLADRADEVLEANALDLAAAEALPGTSGTALDRLRLTPARLQGMAQGLRQVATLPDPVGEVTEGRVMPNGLRVRRVRVPLGVVGVIYENRPNVTSDAAGLCLKSGNVAFLRGSSAAIASNRVIASILRESAAKAGLPEDAVLLMDDASREAATAFMRLRGVIDCLIPRGGPSLVKAVIEQATVPYVIDGDGNCHVYVDAAADLDLATAVVVNAKMSRPGVCNAAESLLVHEAVAREFLPRVAAALEGVELLGDEGTRAILPSVVPVTEADYATEFLDLKLSVAVVDDIDAALDHIARYGSGHSEAIITNDLGAAGRFTREVDAAAVLVNASTRFVDGAELGLGAEIGISTQKLHARGPMGLRELTTLKYVVEGDGQVRL
ncbi:MAG: glutamate-5-semialdehyde dehydrogenase [Acidimicrobiales bacterium]|nr:MAG: glutamate-5-semialdehyde dehydrogenase [Acidimicrobiales bacterium]